MPKGATAAPYKIFKKSNGKWAVRNNMGEEKAEFDSEEAARNYQKALYARVPGAAKAAEKKDYTGKQKRAVKIKASGIGASTDKVLALAWSDAARAASAAARHGKGGGAGSASGPVEPDSRQLRQASAHIRVGLPKVLGARVSSIEAEGQKIKPGSTISKGGKTFKAHQLFVGAGVFSDQSTGHVYIGKWSRNVTGQGHQLHLEKFS